MDGLDFGSRDYRGAYDDCLWPWVAGRCFPPAHSGSQLCLLVEMQFVKTDLQANGIDGELTSGLGIMGNMCELRLFSCE